MIGKQVLREMWDGAWSAGSGQINISEPMMLSKIIALSSQSSPEVQQRLIKLLNSEYSEYPEVFI